MIIVGCDYHPSFQQIAFVDTETGELKEQRLAHREGAEEFYRALAATVSSVWGWRPVDIARWFEVQCRADAQLRRKSLLERPQSSVRR
jgi:transposase